MSLILGVDPGPTEHGYVLLDTEAMRVTHCGSFARWSGARDLFSDYVAIEQIQPMGQVLSHPLLATIRAQVRLEDTWPSAILVPRASVKFALCGTLAAKESQVNSALRSIFCEHHGCTEKQLKGTKKEPGPLHGVTGHCMAALAVAVTVMRGQG